MMIKVILYLSLIAILCFSLATDDPQAIKLIENTTSGIIGSVLGGITAGISIIFAALTSLKGTTPNISNNNARFITFIDNLKSDVMILIGCLTLSILLPYLRVVGIPFIIMPTGEYIPSSDSIYTTAELIIIVISMLALIEIISVMFNIFKISMADSEQPKAHKDN
ncbi:MULTISPECIES: hypothetical protein [unclassified Pseudoalteromonas]|uniref:hypothetical protein n=1 Tax=unclassified Pseudoalteromonas TaxID=194690 RepID=UPI0013FDE110|nr:MULTISPECIES: hypothetical protein [unclassified Pseudoalteromonas]MBH0078990.1 hypothetical protein [Pseudoalteromonas sp. NZS11]